MKYIKRITSFLRKEKLSDFTGVLGGDEFEDFEKAALELRHSPSTRLKRLNL